MDKSKYNFLVSSYKNHIFNSFKIKLMCFSKRRNVNISKSSHLWQYTPTIFKTNTSNLFR